MTKRSKTTLFGLLALIAAFGLILTGCPDPNSETKTEWQDKPSVQVSEVSFTDGDGAAPATIEFSVTLPEGAWDETALPGVTGAGLAEVFTIKVNESVQTATVDTWLTANSFTIERDSSDQKKLNVTVFDDSGTTATYISKVSVGLNSVAALAGLIEDNPELTLNTHAKEWKTPKALVTIADVSFVDGVANISPPSVTVTLKLSTGAWYDSITPANARSLFAIADGSGAITISTSQSEDVDGDTLTVTVRGATGATNYVAVTATLNGVDMSSGFTANDAPAIVDLDSTFTTGKVTLATTSQGTASYKSITGLTAEKSYIVLEGGVWYPVTTEGTLDTGLTELTAAAIGSSGIANLATNVVSITGLDNTKTYDVYIYSSSVASSDVAVAADAKNRMLYVNADQAITIGNNIGNGELIVVLGAGITSSTTTVSGGAPSQNSYIHVGSKKWTFQEDTGYTVAGIVVTFAETDHFFKITGFGASTKFKITRANS